MVTMIQNAANKSSGGDALNGERVRKRGTLHREASAATNGCTVMVESHGIHVAGETYMYRK
jgi:hypothetical protein